MKLLKMRLIPVVVVTFGLAATPAMLAQGCGGGPASGSPGGCNMAGMSGHAASGGHEGHGGAPAAEVPQNVAPRAVFMQPVQSVYDGYIQVHAALAQDSLEGVSSTANAMTKDIVGDSMKMLPPKVAQQSEALANAKDLQAARAAFKSLSESLIQYLKNQKVPPGAYHEAYCPMAKASWLQTGATITNPYLGKEMLRCGQFKS
jgi:Cu(I)/Ag(I) efflux system membrane fusion protein